MADTFQYVDPVLGNLTFASKDIGGIHYQEIMLTDTSGVAASPLTNAQLRASSVAITNTGPSGSTVTSIVNSITSQTLLTANSSRKGGSIYNDTTIGTAYVKLGTTASTSGFTFKLGPEAFYELPYPAYTGRIDAISTLASGNLLITELY